MFGKKSEGLARWWVHDGHMLGELVVLGDVEGDQAFDRIVGEGLVEVDAKLTNRQISMENLQ